MDFRTKTVEVYGVTLTAKFRTSNYMGPGRVYERAHVVSVSVGEDCQIIDDIRGIFDADFIAEVEHEIDLLLREEGDQSDEAQSLFYSMGMDEPVPPFLRRAA